MDAQKPSSTITVQGAPSAKGLKPVLAGGAWVIAIALLAIMSVQCSLLPGATSLLEGTPVSGITLVPPVTPMPILPRVMPTQSTGTIKFSGYNWMIKSTSVKAEPGGNLWSPSSENVSVDSTGRLHLRVTKRNEVWYSAEIFTAESFGYGVYRFYVDSDLNYDPNVAAGFFTWSEDPAFNHREIDIEFSTWTNTAAQKNAQYVVQPYTVAQNIHYFVQPSGPSIHSFTWQPSKLVFQSLKGQNITNPDSDSVIGQWTYPRAIPRPGGEKVHMNFWLVEGRVPRNGQEAEVIIRKFEFVPSAQ